MTTTTDGEEEEDEEEGKQSKLSIELKDKIDLTENEREIFDRLLSTLRFCNLDAQLRVAGGWVRDKLLGRESDDIEIAIDNMSGSEFLDKLKEYLSSRDEQVQGDSVIKRNPEQSRHLETPKMRLYDQWIDFVGLRCDEYTENSRIPAMVVFAFPSSSEPAPSENCGSLCQAYLEAMWSLIQTPGLGKFSGEQRRLALYASLFLPFRKIVYEDKGKLIPIVNYMFKFSLKRKTSDAETVMNIHRTTERFLLLIPSFHLKNNVQLDMLNWVNDVIEHWKSSSFDDPEVPETLKTRLLTEFLLRDIKGLWRVVALLTSLLLSTVDCTNEDQETGHLDFQLNKLRESYLNIEKTIRELGLDNIWEEKTMVNDSEITKIAEISREDVGFLSGAESPVYEEEPLQRKLASDDKQMEAGEKDQESDEVVLISGISSSPANPVSGNASEIVPLSQSPLLQNDIRRVHCHLHYFLLISLVPVIFGGDDQNAGGFIIVRGESFSLLPNEGFGLNLPSYETELRVKLVFILLMLNAVRGLIACAYFTIRFIPSGSRMVYEGEYLSIDGLRSMSFCVSLVFYACAFGMRGGRRRYYHCLLGLATLMYTLFCGMKNLVCLSPPSLTHPICVGGIGFLINDLISPIESQ